MGGKPRNRENPSCNLCQRMEYLLLLLHSEFWLFSIPFGIITTLLKITIQHGVVDPVKIHFMIVHILSLKNTDYTRSDTRGSCSYPLTC